MSKSNINAVRRYLRDLHKRLVGELQKADGDAFHLREWRGNLGRGHTATLDNGALFERAWCQLFRRFRQQIAASGAQEANNN